MNEMNNRSEPHIIVKDLTMAFGSFVVQRDLTFTINHGDILAAAARAPF
jgi:phospholipid/cholesterol/gamma-HCH transport system ATP-binding protein